MADTIETIALPNDGVLIVGAGIAGLYTALKLAPLPVTIITAAPLGRGSSSTWAQGGLAVAKAEGDSPALHLQDTIEAGAGLVDLPPAEILTNEGPERVDDLIAMGVPFDRDGDGNLVFGREAAHNRRRIIHVSGDQAGAAIMKTLAEKALAADHITLLERHVGEDIWVQGDRAAALLTFDIEGQKRKLIRARNIILATGGIGGLFSVTTNPIHAQGHGIAMAFRVGAAIMDPEFVQFHPTAMDLKIDPAPLATEALRGEGAILIDKTGKRLMEGVHPMMDLAPRDIVAREIARAIADGRGAFLDTRNIFKDGLAGRFATVDAALQKAGLDARKNPIPIAPAAHYHMGGVASDLNGRTSRPGLWAIGEVAASGVHGANRLASNSLLEALVFGGRAAKALLGEEKTSLTSGTFGSNLPKDTHPAPASAEEMAPLRKMMSQHCGLLRNGENLKSLLDFIRAQDDSAPRSTGYENAMMSAYLIALAALGREESRGAHQREDFPDERAAHHRLFHFDPQRGIVATSRPVATITKEDVA